MQFCRVLGRGDDTQGQAHLGGKTLNPWCLEAALGTLLTAGTTQQVSSLACCSREGTGAARCPSCLTQSPSGDLHPTFLLPVSTCPRAISTAHARPFPHHKTGQGPGNGSATHTQCTDLGCIHTPGPDTIPLPVPAPTTAAPQEQPSSGREPSTACTHPACTWPGSPALGPGTTFQTAQPVPFPPPRRSKSFISLGASARGKGRSTWEPLPAPACAGR